MATTRPSSAPAEDAALTRILNSAREQFVRFGYSKVTTDEIASELGISKKTLYKYFASKEALFRAVMQRTMDDISAGAAAIIYNEELEYTRKLTETLAFFSEQIARVFSRPLMRDLRRKLPHIWQEVEAFREEQIFTKFASLIAEGVKQGVIRSDIHQEVIVRIYFAAAQQIMNPETLLNLPLTANEAFDAIVKTLFEGLLTERARTNLAGEG